jgi:hypothetical protein
MPPADDQSDQEEFEIFPPYEAFYIESLLFCTESALKSATLISQLFERMQKGPVEFDHQMALNHMRNIVLQGAAISRYLWPTEKRYAARGARLRKVLSVADECPLKSRKLRNQMEHFDEYLDDYLKKGIVGHIIPHYFGPSSDAGGVPEHFFQAYFTDTGAFEVLGERYEILPIADEIARIHDMLVGFSKAGDRFPQG